MNTQVQKLYNCLPGQIATDSLRITRFEFGMCTFWTKKEHGASVNRMNCWNIRFPPSRGVYATPYNIAARLKKKESNEVRVSGFVICAPSGCCLALQRQRKAHGGFQRRIVASMHEKGTQDPSPRTTQSPPQTPATGTDIDR